MSEGPLLLELESVSRYYSGGAEPVRALDGVSLTVNHGEFVAIVGQSGSGKSTLMNIIGCLDRPSSGIYRILGRDVTGLSRDELAELRRRTFGFVFQRYNLLPTSTAEENVEIPAIYAALAKPERVARARALLEKLGLGNRRHHRPGELSGGQQQRVAIARALVNDPAIILADEPTGALDTQSGQEVVTLLKQLHREGRTIILITHEPKVAAHAERIIEISDGRIVSVSGRSSAGAAVPVAADERAQQGNFAAEIAEAARMAMRSLRANLFRTVLTLLGIIIGVASVIVMLGVGDGSKQKVLDQITAMGTNLLSIRPGTPGVRGSGDVVTLVPDDARAITQVPNVELVVPERSGRFTVRYANKDHSTTVQGVGSALPLAREWPLARGAFFTERDLQSYAPVAILGQTAVNSLFPEGTDPIGRYILVRNSPFEVIGVLAPKGASAWGGDQDDVVFVPVTTGTIRLFGKPYLNAITVKVADVSKIDETQTAISQLLMRRHRTEDFRIRNMASILDTASETQNTLTILLGAVAAISLLVGGIGVMNIMLVSVTERTREIGIRMATGARTRDILLQFNTEAAVVCTVGGLLGILFGVLIGSGLNLAGIDVILSLFPALLAFSCAVGTGLIFGYLPARKAALLDPVVALASE